MLDNAARTVQQKPNLANVGTEQGWVAGFRGVEAKYLPNGLAWHHVLDRKPFKRHHREWLQLAVNS